MKSLLLGHSYMAKLRKSDLKSARALKEQFKPMIWGLGGARIFDVQSWLETLEEDEYDMVLLDIGTNDVTSRPPSLVSSQEASEAAHRLLALASHFKATKNIKMVIICTVIPRGSTGRYSVESNAPIFSFNKVLKDFSEKSENSAVLVWDLLKYLPKCQAKWDEMTTDGVHLKDNYYERYVYALKTALYVAAKKLE